MSTTVDTLTSGGTDLMQQAHQLFSYWLKKGEPRVRVSPHNSNTSPPPHCCSRLPGAVF